MSVSSQDRARSMLDSVLASSQPRRSRSGPQTISSDHPSSSEAAKKTNETDGTPKPLSPVKHPSPFVGFQSARGTKLSVPKTSALSKIPKDLRDGLTALVKSNYKQTFEPSKDGENSSTGPTPERDLSSDSSIKSPSSSQFKAMDILSSITTSKPSRTRASPRPSDDSKMLVEEEEPQRLHDESNVNGLAVGGESMNGTSPSSPLKSPSSSQSKAMDMLSSITTSRTSRSRTNSNGKDNLLKELYSSQENSGNTGKETRNRTNPGSPLKSPSSSQSKAMDIMSSITTSKRSRTNSKLSDNSAMFVEEESNGKPDENSSVGFSSGKDARNGTNSSSPSSFGGFKSARGSKLSTPQSSTFSKIPKELMENFKGLMGSGFNANFDSISGESSSVGFTTGKGTKLGLGGTTPQESPKNDFKIPSSTPSFAASSGFKSAKGSKLSTPQNPTFSKIPKELMESFKGLMGSGFNVNFDSISGESSSVGFTTGKGTKLPDTTPQESPKNDFKLPSPAPSFVTPSGFKSGNGRRLSAPQPSTLPKISKGLEDDFKALLKFSNQSEKLSDPNSNSSNAADEEPKQARNLEKEFSDSQSSSQSKAMDILNSIRMPTKTPRPIARKRPNSDTKVSGRVKLNQRELESPPPAKIAKPEIQIESWSQQASQVEMFSTQDDISFLDKLQCEEIPSQIPALQDSKVSESSDNTSNVNGEDENFDELLKDIDLKSMDSDDGSGSESNTTHKRDSSPLGNLFSSATPTKMRYPAPVVLKNVPQSAQKTKALGSATRMFKQGRPYQTPLKSRVFVSPGKKPGSTDGSISGTSVHSSPSRSTDTPLDRSSERRRSLKVIPPPSLVHKYSLKDLEIDCGNKRSATVLECLQYKLLTQVIEMTSMSATMFRFRIIDFVNELPTGLTCTGDTIGPEDLISLLKVSVDSPHLLTESWVRNQWRWVVWKLASYERRFPSVFGGKYLNPRNVFQELCHRYNKECSKSRRSALKRIFEKDDISSRYMVLCVSSVSVPPPAVPEDQQSQQKAQEPQQGNPSDGSNPNANCLWIELTDGWYPVKVQLDEYLSKALMCGKIYEGQKLRICGAQRCGSDSGQDPLEAPDGVWFRIFVNGTRRAEWDAKLGFQKSKAFTVSLFSLKDMGGPIPSVEVCVLRVYPPIYSERIDGEGEEKKRIVRTEREEEWEVRAFEEKFERMFEQKVSEYSRNVRGEDMAGIHERVSSEVQKEMEKSRRDVTKILRFRVRDCPSFLATSPYSEADDGAKFKETILSVTAPQESNEVDIKEGSWIKFYGVGEYKRRPVISGMHDFPEKEIPLHLSVSGSLPWRLLFTKKGSPSPPTFVPRQICRADTVGNQCSPGYEFDFVGIAVAFGECTLETGEIADPKRDRGEPIDIFLYATDTSENIIAILIHTKMGFQPKFSAGEVFTAANLLYSRFDSENDIHVCDASDTVAFNQKPIKPHLAKAKAELVEWAAKSSSAIETAIQRTSLIIDGITLSQLQ